MTQTTPATPVSANFVNLLCVACEDPLVHSQLEALLTLPAASRHAVVQTLVAELRAAAAPEAIVDAIAWLVDDEVAWRAQQVMATLRRP